MSLKIFFSKFLSTLLFSVVCLGIIFNKPAKAQTNDSVNVSAGIYSCILNLTVWPEKRIPQTNNWQTELNLWIYNQSNILQGQVVASSNSQGQATINLCDSNINLLQGTYSFYIKGLSHLIRSYPNITSFDNYEETIDLSGSGLLFAGETSVVFDNYINVLDFITQVSNIYTTDNKNDLNQDSEVNVLDISNTITNYYQAGEALP